MENLRRSQRTSPQVLKTTTTAELTTMVDDISMVADTSTTTPKIPQNRKTVQNGATERKDLRESKKTVMKIALNVVVRDVKEEQADVGTSR